nr:MAG TPA: hypothetical protein [Caudoviricetes sp.]
MKCNVKLTLELNVKLAIAYHARCRLCRIILNLILRIILRFISSEATPDKRSDINNNNN